jgi:selenocysteine lyase/cysteine desulfurase
LYVRAHAAEEMQPMLVGSNATKNFLHWLDYDLTPLPGAGRFRMGTWNSVGWCGLEQSVKLLQELGIGNVDTHTTGLATEAIAMLGRRGFDVITPPGNGPIVTFRVEMDDRRTDKLMQALQAHHVSVAKQLDAQGNPHIRLSFHAYNTREELHRFESIFCNTYEEFAWD